MAEASCRATMVRENTVATTVMRLPEITESTVRAASAPPEKTTGSPETLEGISPSSCRVTPNRTTAPAVMRLGTNQKLEPSRSQT